MMQSYDRILFQSISHNVKDNQEYSYFKRHETYKYSRKNRVKTPRYINTGLVRFLPTSSRQGGEHVVPGKPVKPPATATPVDSTEESDCSDDEEPPELLEEEITKDEQQVSISDDEELTADLRDDMEMEQETDDEC
jgi:hypothetical protein